MEEVSSSFFFLCHEFLVYLDVILGAFLMSQLIYFLYSDSTYYTECIY